MSNPDMSPEEMAWAFKNAGNPPPVKPTTSQVFAARARAQEAAAAQQRAALKKRGLDERNRDLQRDREWNEAVHAQDMAASKAHHQALMSEYTLVDRAKAELGALNMQSDDWKQGFVLGLVAGALVSRLVASWFGKR
jgi:hypothetical protein